MPTIDPNNILASVPGAQQGPRITAIEVAKRNPERRHIYLDGKYFMSLSMLVVADARLKVGETLPTDRVIELQDAERFNKMYDRAIVFLAARPRSEYEVIAKLKEVQRKAAQPKPVRKYGKSRFRQQGFGRRQSTKVEEEAEEELDELPEELDELEAADVDDPDLDDEAAEAVADEEIIERVLTRLREQNYVDDLAFARFWISNRQQFRPTGERLLKVELKQKRIADAVIVQALEQHNTEQAENREREQELARNAAALAHPSVSNTAEDEEAAEEDEEWEEAPTAEQQGALDAARKKLRTYGGLDRQTFKRRMTAFLQRRGYGFGTISFVTDKLWDELQNS